MAMKLGLYLRNMGPQSTRETLVACARAAEDAGIDDLWVADHIAIPPDDSAGSGGRYLDPLATLAFLAAATGRVGLGTGVLVLPYRPPLATAKWVATIQELSAGRLLLGVGLGWMHAEFRAVGVPRAQRARISDDTLAFLHRCFAGDEVEANGQRFLFLPRPPRPPIFVGGAPPHALARTVALGDGWMPMGGELEKLGPAIADLRERARTAGRPPPEVCAGTSLAIDDRERLAEQLGALERVGVTRVVYGWRYPDAAAFAAAAAALVRARESMPSP
jgi:probable F420-dependent oxidoreductase